ncbi:MAG: phospho-N-acetylmuramoyl-pentapeptide-transferase [Deltaproteobacteria bacterium]|nr:phospho-N-acetylmuramoyl-pentapeptide-transferase [Deltaproteobacteria bacterium]
MLLELVQQFFPDHLIANLFRYILFRSFAAAVIAFLFTVLLMPKLIALLQKKSVKQIVRDDGPQSHLKKSGTPTMGGVMMVLGILISSLLLCRLNHSAVWISLFALMSFGAVGFADDYLKLTKKNTKGVSFRVKMISMGLLSILITQFAVMTGVDTSVNLPFFKHWSVDIGWVFYIWGFFVLNGAANAVNLTDGLDGLAIVPVMTTAFVLLITSYVTGNINFSNYLQFQYFAGAGELSVIMASVIGVGLGFLWYNCHPAEIFMGDVGSLSLGGLLGAVAILTHKEFALLIAGMLFVIEALSVMLQVGSYKLRNKKRVFKMAPLHHHFELSGWPESKVIVRFWILSILFALMALSTLKIR